MQTKQISRVNVIYVEILKQWKSIDSFNKEKEKNIYAFFFTFLGEDGKF